MSNKQLKTILYAEDEEDIREIAKIALEELGGYSVVYCKNGHETVEQAQHIQSDLILLDVMMPGMDGPATLQDLRKLPHYESVPAIFMTAKIQPEEMDTYKKIGAIGVIAKPFDPMKLAETIKNIWDEHTESRLQIK